MTFKLKTTLINHVFVPFSRLVGSCFFKRKYLRGRFFDESLGGWYWMWRALWFQKLLGFNRHVPWPVSHCLTISKPENIHFHPDDLNNFQTNGCYFHNADAHIYLGRGTLIAPNVGLITGGHNPTNPQEDLPGRDIHIGEGCWIGMNSVVLYGVELGPGTVVGAGSVVTKSFPMGNCVVAGSPARKIRDLTSERHTCSPRCSQD